MITSLANSPTAGLAVGPIAAPITPSVAETQPAVPQGLLDFPSIKSWLIYCGEHLECGRDKHDYNAMLQLFDENGCTQIDDIVRLTPELIVSLGEKQGTKVTIGLALCLHEYAISDVARVKANGRFFPSNI